MAHSRGGDPLVVELPAGRLRGGLENGVAVFRGVPYAAPPTGPLRWRPTRPHAGWPGIRDATVDGPSSPQPWVEGGDAVLGGHGAPPFDDDCLTVNIWTPAADAARRPVLVWIHGGGFVTGSGSLPHYSGEAFARSGDVVVVTVNYRTGPLGYLYVGPGGSGGSGGSGAAGGPGEPGGPSGPSGPDGADGADGVEANFWLGDQLAALRWVHDNIAYFGGDPDTVTVAGHSGGALSAAALAAHPDARGLLKRVILQSPPLGLDLPGTAAYRERTDTYLELAGVKTVEELRALPWQLLIEALGGLFERTGRWGHWPMPVLPVLDPETLPRHPAEALLHGQAAANVDVMIGWTREEANFRFALDQAHADATREQVTDRIAETFGAAAAPAVYAVYERHRPGARPADVVMDLITDEVFRVPGDGLAEARAALGHPVWAYEFGLRTPALGGRLGAAHCLELPFVFDNFDRWAHVPFLTGIDPAARDRLTRAMHRAWIAFVRTGDPNHPDLPLWQRYDTPARTTMRFDTRTATTPDPVGPARRLHAQRERANG
ncbi:carboxylesterase/lipase family protein [Streptomyces sp. 12297]